MILRSSFWRREGCSLLSISLLCFLYIQHCIIEEVCCQISFYISGGILLKLAAFNFFNTVSSLMSSWPLIIFWIGLSAISGRLQNRFLNVLSTFEIFLSWLAAFNFGLECILVVFFFWYVLVLSVLTSFGFCF